MDIKFSSGLNRANPATNISLETVNIEMSARQFLAFVNLTLLDSAVYKSSLHPFELETLTEFAYAAQSALRENGMGI